MRKNAVYVGPHRPVHPDDVIVAQLHGFQEELQRLEIAIREREERKVAVLLMKAALVKLQQEMQQ